MTDTGGGEDQDIELVLQGSSGGTEWGTFGTGRSEERASRELPIVRS